MTKAVLIIMAKAPRVGVGKTRLAKAIGKAEAWRVNRALQARTLRISMDTRWLTLLCVTPDSAASLTLPGAWPAGVKRIAQGGGDLGARLARALGLRRRVAVIGTDCPAISRALIAQAFAALKRAPYALGPTEDGGFWIFSARSGRDAARAMAEVRWSSEQAGADVLRNLRARVEMLPTLWDVDEAADLKRRR